MTGPAADFDNDGTVNLMEYALGLNPSIPSSTTNNIVRDFAAGTYQQLTITRNPAATDITYLVEVSSDLTHWSSTQTVIEENTPTTLRVRDTHPNTGSHRRFIRMKITQP